MTPEKIISIIKMYEERLCAAGVPKLRMDQHKNFGQLTKEQLLAHAHFLCAGVKLYAKIPSRQRKTGSHLTAVQMCLSFAGWYTLDDLMAHNRPELIVSGKPV
jgi:hypothetical protein